MISAFPTVLASTTTFRNMSIAEQASPPPSPSLTLPSSPSGLPSSPSLCLPSSAPPLAFPSRPPLTSSPPRPLLPRHRSCACCSRRRSPSLPPAASRRSCHWGCRPAPMRSLSTTTPTARRTSRVSVWSLLIPSHRLIPPLSPSLAFPAFSPRGVHQLQLDDGGRALAHLPTRHAAVLPGDPSPSSLYHRPHPP